MRAIVYPSADGHHRDRVQLSRFRLLIYAMSCGQLQRFDWGSSMKRFRLSLIIAFIALTGCGESKQTSSLPLGAPATPAKAPSYMDLVANPTGHAGYPVELKVSLVLGKLLLPTGESATASGQTWEDPPGTEHSVAPSQAAANSVDESCVFLVMNDNRTPLLPLQLVLVENLSPCLAGSAPPVLTGTVLGVKDVSLAINGQPTTVKALTLSEPNFEAPH